MIVSKCQQPLPTAENQSCSKLLYINLFSHGNSLCIERMSFFFLNTECIIIYVDMSNRGVGRVGRVGRVWVCPNGLHFLLDIFGRSPNRTMSK